MCKGQVEPDYYDYKSGKSKKAIDILKNFHENQSHLETPTESLEHFYSYILSRKGCMVCKGRGKVPIGKTENQVRIQDFKQVRALLDRGFGIRFDLESEVEADKLIVYDLDFKNVPDNQDRILLNKDALKRAYELNGARVTTPNGGFHRYFRNKEGSLYRKQKCTLANL